MTSIKKYGRMLGKGIIIEMVPGIAKGVLVEILKKYGASVKGTTQWVQDDVSLWDIIGPKYQFQLQNLGDKIGNLNWLTSDWIIDTLRHDLPGIASLFLGWSEAREWLDRQIEIIKGKIAE